MKKFTKILCIFMMLSFVNIGAYGAELELTEGKGTTYTLTLEQALDMALKDNPKLKAFEVKQVSNKINLDSAILTMNKYKNSPVMVSNYEIKYIKEGYYKKSYEMLIRLTDKEIEQAKAQISYNATESYFNYILAQKLCLVAQNALNLANDNYNAVKKRFDLGMISNIDLKTASLSKEQCKNTYETYKRNFEIAKENLKINLQLDEENCDFVLTSSINCSDFSPNVNEDIEKAMDTRYDLSSLEESVVLAEKYFGHTKGLTQSSAKYQSAYSDLVSKQNSYDSTTKLVRLSLISTYNKVLDSMANVDICEKTNEISKQKYEINKVKFENGMITNSQLTESLNEYLNSGVNLENAKLSQKLAMEKYYYEISIGL